MLPPPFPALDGGGPTPQRAGPTPQKSGPLLSCLIRSQGQLCVTPCPPRTCQLTLNKHSESASAGGFLLNCKRGKGPLRGCRALAGHWDEGPRGSEHLGQLPPLHRPPSRAPGPQAPITLQSPAGQGGGGPPEGVGPAPPAGLPHQTQQLPAGRSPGRAGSSRWSGGDEGLLTSRRVQTRVTAT